MEKMNILMVAIGSQGDVNPFLKLGMALQKRGHGVTILSNDYFKASVQQARLNFASVGMLEDYHKTVDNVTLNNPTKTTKAIMTYLYINSMEAVFNAIEKRFIPQTTLILSITLAFGARIAQEKLGIPLLTCHLAPVSFPSISRPARFKGVWMPHWMPGIYKESVWCALDKAADIFFAPPINAFRQKLGLSPVKSIIRHWIHSPDKVIGFFPDWFAQPQPDWPDKTQLTSFVLNDEADTQTIPSKLKDFLEKGEPPIVFTAGTAVNGANSFFKASAETCEKRNFRGVFLSRYPEQIPQNLPSHILHCDYAPFSQLLPHASVLVHHGGIGTSAQALKAGLPQLVVPFGLDQFDNSFRLKTLGVSAELPMKKYSGKTAEDTLVRLLDDKTIHEQCKLISKKMQQEDPLPSLCEMVEQQVTGHGKPRLP